MPTWYILGWQICFPTQANTIRTIKIIAFCPGLLWSVVLLQVLSLGEKPCNKAGSSMQHFSQCDNIFDFPQSPHWRPTLHSIEVECIAQDTCHTWCFFKKYTELNFISGKLYTWFSIFLRRSFSLSIICSIKLSILFRWMDSLHWNRWLEPSYWLRQKEHFPGTFLEFNFSKFSFLWTHWHISCYNGRESYGQRVINQNKIVPN